MGTVAGCLGRHAAWSNGRGTFDWRLTLLSFLALSYASASLAIAPGVASAQRATLRASDHAVVRILGVQGETMVAVGTGFFVTDTGFVATAAHVVLDARVVVGVSASTGEAFRLLVRVLDESTDTAILQAVGVTPPATLSLEGPLPTIVGGDQVSISGYSRSEMVELAPAITIGHVSRSLSDGSMELSASVNPGQSGGPVLSASSELLGLVSARADPSSGMIGVALIRPREEIAASLARATLLPDAAPANELARLIAFRAEARVLASITWEEVERALSAARTPPEYAEVLVATHGFLEQPGHDDAVIAQALRTRARGLMSRFPQLLVLYPSLARIAADA